MSGIRSVLSLYPADDNIHNFGQSDSTSRNEVEIDQGCEHDGTQMYFASASRRLTSHFSSLNLT
jgi:hypothetical protein